MDELITPTQIAQISTSLNQSRQLDAIASVGRQIEARDQARKLEDAFLKDCRDRLFDVYEWLEGEGKVKGGQSPATAYVRLSFLEERSQPLFDHRIYPDFQSKEFITRVRAAISERKSSLRSQIDGKSINRLDREIFDHIQAEAEKLRSELLANQNEERRNAAQQKLEAAETEQLFGKFYIAIAMIFIVFVAWLFYVVVFKR